VFTRNFELDSVAYFFNFLWNFHQNPDIWSPGSLLGESLIHDAVVAMLQLLVVEQCHEEESPYRYSELPREGLGPPVAYTGMVWSAFRPSDDPQKYSYNLPDNMYLWGALRRLLLLNNAVWQDQVIDSTATKLMNDVHHGIEQHGIVEVEPGVRVYAYEVDGLGGVLADFDDPNLPSLLALPLLGYEVYNRQIYATTRARILSHNNPYFFEGNQLKGLGSPHTAHNFVWPLATAVDALTAESDDSVGRQADLLRDLLKMASGNGLAHESVHVDNLDSITRPEFGWANAMTVSASWDDLMCLYIQ
jgi:meiotically up-regulated gene 157 (Mug157) protein